MNTKDRFIIQGLAGARTLKGSVTINGAKNAALKAMAAAILFDGPVTLENMPDNSDINTLSIILSKLGAKVESGKSGAAGGRSLIVDATPITSTRIDEDLGKGMRASVVLTGPLLGRYGKATFPAPGGCVIGARPIDLFLSGYQKMGAEFSENGIYDFKAEKGLRGAEIFFNKVTVGGTETLMMAAVLAKGTTILKNCAMEPEIANVAEWLNASGAKITGVGTPTITIEGTNGKLLSAKTSFVTIPDRITAGSFLILGALCAEELSIKSCRPDHLEAVTQLLIDSGADITIGKNTITVKNNSKKPVIYRNVASLRTHEYPGFPTDLQSPIVTFLTQTPGDSVVFETIFEGRFKYVEDLIKLGGNVTTMNPREIFIKGPSSFKELPDAEELTAHDIRAGFAVVLAALLGKGTFTVNNVHLIDRGYEKLEAALSGLGADIKRVAA